MVTMRRGNYITPEKNPPAHLECSPALCQLSDKEDKAKAKEEGEAISAAVDYAASLLTFNDKQLYYENDVAAGGNDDAGGDDRGMNDDDGGDNRGGMNDDEGEQQVEEEMGEAWERVAKKRNSDEQ